MRLSSLSSVQDYLLEQSRITHQSEHERNYHVFYQLTAAAQRDASLAAKYQVEPPASYHYLNQSASSRLDGVDDADKFDALRLAFEVVQIPSQTTDAIFSVLSAILWLGNLKFQVNREINCSLIAFAVQSLIILDVLDRI